MARRPTSARLVGREAELADLRAALASEDPDRPVILLSGEAGIGKTRLLAELIERVGQAPREEQAWNVVRGSCLRLAEGELPFAPVLEILDAIRDRGLTDRAARTRGELAGVTPIARSSADARTVRFVHIHDALSAAAAEMPLLLVIDDLHWADRSTLDLLLFLARRLRGGRVLLLAAYRSDELHRRHPLRPIIAELARGFVRERVDLVPLESDAVVEQITQLGGSIEDGVLRAIVTRAEGNPFYVEELVALETGQSRLPESLRDVLLSRVAELDPTTIRVLGACAVIGREADEGFLAQVVELDAAAVANALRIAVDHSILATGSLPTSFRFRHALLEEAVHDDLLPADRVPLHRRVAEALRDQALEPTARGVPPGELARHLDLGGQQGAAIEAYLDAADVAFRALAWAEGVAAYERAAELAESHDVADSLRGRLLDLVIPTAMALNWSGASGRSIALLRVWIARTQAVDDASAAATLEMALSLILNDVGEELEARAAVDAAVRLWPPDGSTPLGVEILLGLTNRAWIDGRNREAIELAERAMRGAEALGDPILLFRSLVNIAATRIALGHIERGLRDVDRARQLQAKHGWLDVVGHLATNIGVSLSDDGELDAALEAWEEGLRMSRELGITRSWDPWNLPGLGLYAFHTGRWSGADGPIRSSRAFHAPGMPTYFNEQIAAHLAAGRGDLAACDAAIAEAVAHTAGLTGEFEASVALARAARADAADDPAARLAQAESGLAALDGLDTFVLRSRLATEAASAAADLTASLHPKRDQEQIVAARVRARAAANVAVAVDEGTAVPGSKSVRWTRANAALAMAEAARAEGADDPASWPPIADAFRELGMQPRVAYAHFRGAVAAITVNEREAGAGLLREARDLASSIGMTVLLRRVEALARVARVELRSASDEAAESEPSATVGRRTNPWGLSSREWEVLALLADGRTNGEIGAALFISTKTASVHVTHILNKLGVSSRVEAALLANQAGVLG